MSLCKPEPGVIVLWQLQAFRSLSANAGGVGVGFFPNCKRKCSTAASLTVTMCLAAALSSLACASSFSFCTAAAAAYRTRPLRSSCAAEAKELAKDFGLVL